MNRLTTLFSLQTELCREIERITKDMLMKKPDSEELVKLKAFEQRLPIPQMQQMEGGELSDLPEMQNEVDYPFPWAIVKIDNGQVPEADAKQWVDVMVVFGVYNDNPKNVGHQELLVLLERVMERFAKDPVLSNRYTVVQLDKDTMFSWALQDDDTFPYYFGTIEMAFELKGYEREDKYA